MMRQLTDDLGPIPPLTDTQAANVRANVTAVARDADDAALLLSMLGVA